MGQKDINEKALEEYNDVFSDIVNVLIFNGEGRVKPDELTNAEEHSIYSADGKDHDQERDVAKYWENVEVRMALIGAENQSYVDKDMPLRIIGYDGAGYRAELYSKKNENGKIARNTNPRYPVVSMILYFGEGDWNGPRNLKDCLNIPEGMEQFVSDYHINVFEIRKLTREQVDKFQSDFWVVADYFYQIENTGKYDGSLKQMLHIREVMHLLSLMNGNDRMEIAYDTIGKVRRVNNMRDYFSELVDKTMAEGRKEGRSQGEIVGTVETMRDFNMTDEQIRDRIVKKYNITPETANIYLSEDGGKYKTLQDAK